VLELRPFGPSFFAAFAPSRENIRPNLDPDSREAAKNAKINHSRTLLLSFAAFAPSRENIRPNLDPDSREDAKNAKMNHSRTLPPASHGKIDLAGRKRAGARNRRHRRANDERDTGRQGRELPSPAMQGDHRYIIRHDRR